jgi:protein-disulfide isomerase
MFTLRKCWLGATSLVAMATSIGCSERDRVAAETPPASAAAAADGLPAVLATVDGEPITLEDVRAETGDDLTKMESSYLRARNRLVSSTLTRMIQERLIREEAAKRNMTPERLLLAEVGGSVEPSSVEARAWYDENSTRTGGRPFEQIEPQIIEHLRTEKRAEAAKKLEERLRAERKVEVHVQPMRLALNNERAPSAGPDNAPVTLVEFSDFQCPFCNRFVPTLKQLQETYGDKLRIVYRQYPITSLHPNAFKAAEASLCAHEQGKFWEIHDVMFQEQSRLSVRELKLLAQRLGMDQKKFEGCLDSGKYTEQVQNDLAEGGKAGMTGTPALFVNGIEIEGGAVPFAKVKQALDRELARVAN